MKPVYVYKRAPQKIMYCDLVQIQRQEILWNLETHIKVYLSIKKKKSPPNPNALVC